jgi:hypothetical protein
MIPRLARPLWPQEPDISSSAGPPRSRPHVDRTDSYQSVSRSSESMGQGLPVDYVRMGAHIQAEVFFAPVKTQERMREKTSCYAPPYPRSQWPLTAHITDPVRLAIVCSGPYDMMEVAPRPLLAISIWIRRTFCTPAPKPCLCASTPLFLTSLLLSYSDSPSQATPPSLLLSVSLSFPSLCLPPPCLSPSLPPSLQPFLPLSLSSSLPPSVTALAHPCHEFLRKKRRLHGLWKPKNSLV